MIGNTAIAGLAAVFWLAPGPAPNAPVPAPMEASANRLAAIPSLPGEGAIRIGDAHALATLSTHIAAQACAAFAGVPGAAADLRAATDSADRAARALGAGASRAGSAFQTNIQITLGLWSELRTVLARFGEDGTSEEDVMHVAKESLKLLELSRHLVAIAAPAQAGPDGATLTLARRQDALAAWLAKEVCMTRLGGGAGETRRAEMGRAMAIFEASLGALREGLPDADLAPPPSEAIAKELARVADRWDEVRLTLRTVVEGEVPSADETERVYREMMGVTDRLAKVVFLHAEAERAR